MNQVEPFLTFLRHRAANIMDDELKVWQILLRKLLRGDISKPMDSIDSLFVLDLASSCAVSRSQIPVPVPASAIARISAVSMMNV